MTYQQKIKAITDSVPSMNEAQLAETLRHENILVKARAMLEIARRKCVTPEIEESLRSAKQDHRPFWNQYKISDIATAVLDIIGVEKYLGNDPTILYLMELE